MVAGDLNAGDALQEFSSAWTSVVPTLLISIAWRYFPDS